MQKSNLHSYLPTFKSLYFGFVTKYFREKKPVDLGRAIGRLDSEDWAVKQMQVHFLCFSKFRFVLGTTIKFRMLFVRMERLFLINSHISSTAYCYQE